MSEILNQKEIHMSMVVKGYGTAQSSMLEVLGIKETERDIVLAIVQTNKCKNLISELMTEFNNHKLKGTFCAIVAPSSASMESLNYIKLIGV